MQTRAAAKRVQSGHVHESDRVLSDTIGPSPFKKQRPPKRRRRGKPGKLCRLNLDVLFLLAAYIHPIDLLGLARTCKSLRELLMDKSSEFVWKTARLQAKGLPDCPADLTEPEYAHLVFYPRCHSCDKYAKPILWRLRRRYCPNCIQERLYHLCECDEVIHKNNVLAMESLSMEDEISLWVDKEQMDSFMDEYNRFADKKQFLSDKKDQYTDIDEHARRCIEWQTNVEEENRSVILEERENKIFECLKWRGFTREIEYFGRDAIRRSNYFFFETLEPLTRKEWTRVWPEWLQIMNNLRFRRLDRTVYQSRRELLAFEYAHYVTLPSPDTPTFDLLPNVDSLIRFPPFQDIIRAPEETRTGDKPFESAFAQLPVLTDAWRKNLVSELDKLVQIPSHLTFRGSSEGHAVASGSAMRMEPPQETTHKLQLACAVFDTGAISTYPDVLHSMGRYGNAISSAANMKHTYSLWERFHVKFLEDAPYIVHACGFDPNVASVEDMDRRNARLKCLVCKDSRVRSWRDALRHARIHHQGFNVRAFFWVSPRWKAIGDEHMDAIRATELSVKKESSPTWFRCLLCRSRAGDVKNHDQAIHHLEHLHNVKTDDIKLGIHYAPLDVYESCSVEMVKEGGQVTFRDPIYV